MGAHARPQDGAGAMTTITTPMSYVYSDGRCMGFIMRRGRLGFEAIDRDENTIGLFTTAAAAASAVFNHQKKSPAQSGAKDLHDEKPLT